MINNEIFSKNNNGDNSDIDKVVPKPLVHVSITGTEISDKIRGGNGNDIISGEDGDDNLQGNEGDDKIDGGNGDDIINGGNDDDDLDGGDDNDVIIGGLNNDKIDGGKKNDNLQGNEGDDKIDGGDGDDEIDGGDGKDDLKGGKGADRFVCDKADKIVDYNSLENDKILGQCNYEDKGLIPPEPVQDKAIPKKTAEKNPLFPNSEIPSSTGNKFEKDIYEHIQRIFK